MNKASVLRSAGLGVTVAATVYLFDPDRGKSRRARLVDQAGALARTVSERARATARYQQGVARGAIHKMTEPFRPSVEVDDETLLQKIRSEAFGRWDGPTQAVEIDIYQGIVTLRGSASSESVDELIDLVKGVNGVDAITNEMSSSQSQ